MRPWRTTQSLTSVVCPQEYPCNSFGAWRRRAAPSGGDQPLGADNQEEAGDANLHHTQGPSPRNSTTRRLRDAIALKVHLQLHLFNMRVVSVLNCKDEVHGNLHDLAHVQGPSDDDNQAQQRPM